MKFPTTFPCPRTVMDVTMTTGLVRTQFEAGTTKQRRRFKNLPHLLNVQWVLNSTELRQVVPWLNDNGYKEFDIDLPSGLAGQIGKPTAAHTVRVVSDLACNMLVYNKDDPTRNLWELNLTLEWMQYSTTVRPAGIWIIARTPANPSPDWYIARTPANPSPDWVLTGTPTIPSA